MHCSALLLTRIYIALFEGFRACVLVMFFLLFQSSKNGNVTALIWGALPQPRSDRQKDRVETNPEQLTAASVHAEISFYYIFISFNF